MIYTSICFDRTRVLASRVEEHHTHRESMDVHDETCVRNKKCCMHATLFPNAKNFDSCAQKKSKIVLTIFCANNTIISLYSSNSGGHYGCCQKESRREEEDNNHGQEEDHDREEEEEVTPRRLRAT